MRFDLENLEQNDPISVLAGLECDLNDLDYRLTGHLGEAACRHTHLRRWPTFWKSARWPQMPWHV